MLEEESGSVHRKRHRKRRHRKRHHPKRLNEETFPIGSESTLASSSDEEEEVFELPYTIPGPLRAHTDFLFGSFNLPSDIATHKTVKIHSKPQPIQTTFVNDCSNCTVPRNQCACIKNALGISACLKFVFNFM
jgi:hypothetical protein